MTKQQLRHFMKTQRHLWVRGNPEAVKIAQVRIGEYVVRFLRQNSWRSAALYWPLVDEIDLRPIASVLENEGILVHLPFARSDTRELAFTYGSFSVPTFVRDDEGIMSFADVAPNLPEVIFLPGLAYTMRGFRLGSGKGYYDRTLRGHPATLVGVAYAIQILNDDFQEPHDVPCHYICTENGIYQCI